jgi:hypothetical protein
MNRRIQFRIKLLLAAAFICVSFSAAAAPKQMDMRVDKKPVDREAMKAERKSYHQWLVSERVVSARNNRLVVNASAEDLDAVDNAPKQSPEIVGFNQEVAVDVSFRNVRLAKLRGRPHSLEYGALEATSDGGYVYTTELSSPGATGLRVQFAGFNLPAGGAMYLYTEEGQVFGPYTGRGPLGNGNFDSNTVAGDSVTVQVRLTGPANEKMLRDTRFQIVGLSHVRPRFMAGTCGYNADCVQNARCGSPGAVSDAENAVAHMVFRSGRYLYICSGGLINDNDDSNSLPLFLTANHCISKGREASSLENFFRFTASCGDTSLCQASLDSLRSSFGRTLGSTVVSTGRAADYTLLRLSEAAPDGSAFLGWNESPVAYNHGQVLHRISHPQGAPQSYSQHSVDTTAGTCGTWPRGDRIYSRDVVGATEGGSSGSPVVNDAGHIVGQLSGACGTNLADNCDADSNATVDGAFASYFSTVEPFLDPGNGSGCTITEPNEEISCLDGQDNDCDGDTDGADSDCATGGFPPGASCQVNADCASNKCKGKPGNLTCR